MSAADPSVESVPMQRVRRFRGQLLLEITPAVGRRGGGTVLVAHRDPTIRNTLIGLLDGAGFLPQTAGDHAEALATVSKGGTSLVVLGCCSPSVGLVSAVRAVTTVPIIVVSPDSDVEFQVRVLDAGADDYVVSPFAPSVLLARIRAVTRRHRDGVRSGVIVSGALRIDVAARRATLRDRPVQLTAREFELLTFMAERPGQTLSRSELLREVWSSSVDWQSPATVTEHVRRIRCKLDGGPYPGPRITSVRSAGYRFDPHIQRDAAGS